MTSNEKSQKNSIHTDYHCRYAFFTELVCAIVLETALPELNQMRKILKGDVPAGESFQRAIGQSYLNYVPAPGYTDEGGIQHNEQGYRGNPVTFQRRPGVKRILFLGGSTTYGWGIGRADQTYPAYLEHLINQALLPSGGKVEVINAGLPWGTTAEMLTHYHFKFHFYRPDLVILNPGGMTRNRLTSHITIPITATGAGR